MPRLRLYVAFKYGGLPFGVLALDCLMFLEPFGMLTALPFPEKGYGGVRYPADAETEEPYVPGSWRDDVEFKRCREHGRCKRNFECARGFDDLLCTDVDTREDYFGIGGFPVRCGFRKGASRSRKIAASILAIVGVGVVWLWINFGIQAYSALNIFFANLRVFFVVSKMNVEWPPVLIGWYAFFQMSQFDVDLVEPTCPHTAGGAAHGAVLEVTRLFGQSHQHFSTLIRVGDGRIKWQPVDCLPAQQIQTLRIHPDERPVPASFFQ